MHLAINQGLVWLLSPEGHLGSYSGPHAWLSTHGVCWLSPESYRGFVELLPRATQPSYQPRICVVVILTLKSLLMIKNVLIWKI
jgi:hypothetical protein